MKTQRTISNTSTGQKVPVMVDLKVKPLMLMGKELKNGHGRVMMDDEWLYINWPNYGLQAMNVNRCEYCEMVYLSRVHILDSIGHHLITTQLQRFINRVADTLVFNKNGITYQVFLIKTKKGYDIGSVKPYWIRKHAPNISYKNIPGRYKSIVKAARGEWTFGHELEVDLEIAFNFSPNEN